jgi:hypothetical protein
MLFELIGQVIYIKEWKGKFWSMRKKGRVYSSSTGLSASGLELSSAVA